MSIKLEDKIQSKLLQEAGVLGFYSCGNMLDDLDITEKFDDSILVGDTLATLINYNSFSDYIEKTPEARVKYYEELKNGIINNLGNKFNYKEYFPDYIKLNKNEKKEIINLIKNEKKEILNIIKRK